MIQNINGTIAFLQLHFNINNWNIFILKYKLIDSISFILITAIFATISEITSKKDR